MEIGRTILPSHMGLTSTPQWSDGGVFDEWRIRYGEIQEIIYPDDDRSVSKKFTEYNVLVQFRDSGAGTALIFNNCLLSNMLGGLADHCEYTLRAPKTPSIKDSKNYGLGLGNKVLIACLNGERSNAYIIGGKRDPQDGGDDKDKGHHYSWLFNGIKAEVNKDGEYILTYTGMTKIDGKLDDSVDSKSPGSSLSMLKNGDMKLLTKDAKQLIHLDNVNGKLILKRDKALEIGDATDAMLLGKSFRDGHKQMHDKLKQLFGTAKDLAQQAGTQLSSAVSTAPGAPIPTVQSAGALLIGLSQVFNQMSQAIDAFEQGAQAKNSYLSKKNSSD